MRRDRTDATTQAVISYVGAGLTAVRTIADRPSDLISIGVARSSLNDMAGGHIVNTASFAGVIPAPFQALYCTTKYGVIGLSESLRFELEDEGIHVSVVCPGNVASRIFGTPILGERVEAKPPEDAIPATEAAKTILTGVANKEGIIALPEKYRTMWRW